jgi:pyruvate dehydrogenase (quinone)
VGFPVPFAVDPRDRHQVCERRLVDVVSARQELVIPPAITADQTYHFGLFMLRAVMDGRGQQLIDLAKVNLFR